MTNVVIGVNIKMRVDLIGSELKGDLESVLKQFTTDEVISKLVSGGSSQHNENFHNILGSIAPKRLYFRRSYGGRVAASVLKKNEGRNYYNLLWKHYKMNSSSNTARKLVKWAHIEKYHKSYKQNNSFKQRRNVLKQLRKVKAKKSSGTYKKGVSLQDNRKKKADDTNKEHYICQESGCNKVCQSKGGLTKHKKAKHS